VLMRILLVLLLLTVGVGSPGLTPGAATSHAAEPAVIPAGTGVVWAMSCPSVTVCYVTDTAGAILATHDAGATWQRQTTGTTISLVSITCPSVDVCFALTACGNSTQPFLLSTTDGGSTWAQKPHPPGCLLPSLACLNVTTCYGQLARPPSGGKFVRTIIHTTDGGRSWQIRGTLTTAFAQDLPGAIACLSASVCYAGGYDAIGRSTDGGKTWAISHILVAPCSAFACHEFDTIACPSQRVCYAGGSYYQGTYSQGTTYSAVTVTTKDGFRTWNRHLIPRLGSAVGGNGPGGTRYLSVGMGALSCPTPTVCVASGTAGRIARTTDGGRSWRVGHIPSPSPLIAIACPSVTVCYATGYLLRLMRSDDGGTTWRDLNPAIFVSGTYSARPRLHTYSQWFTATSPWQVTVGVWDSNSSGCPGGPGVPIYVQNTANKRMAGPIHPTGPGSIGEYSRTVRVTGRLRLDVESPHCTEFSVRIDGVE
jgi:photosystem II stability/assembly factor-like uncharacterized protein